MRLFDRDRIHLNGLSVAELAIVGGVSALCSLLFACLLALMRGEPCWQVVLRWPSLRAALGNAVGVPLIGIVVSRGLGLGLLGQLFAVSFIAAGGGPALALAVESLIHLLLRVLGG